MHIATRTDLGLEEQADLLHEYARRAVAVAPRGRGQPAQGVGEDGQLLPMCGWDSQIVIVRHRYRTLVIPTNHTSSQYLWVKVGELGLRLEHHAREHVVPRLVAQVREAVQQVRQLLLVWGDQVPDGLRQVCSAWLIEIHKRFHLAPAR